MHTLTLHDRELASKSKSSFRSFWEGFWNGISFFPSTFHHSPAHDEMERRIQKMRELIALMEKDEMEGRIKDMTEMRKDFEEALAKVRNEYLEKKSSVGH